VAGFEPIISGRFWVIAEDITHNFNHSKQGLQIHAMEA